MSTEAPLRVAASILAPRASPIASDDERLARAAELAEALARAARAEESFVDRQQRRFLGRLCTDDAGQAFVSAIADVPMRTADRRHEAGLVRALVDGLGVPRFLPAPARLPLALLDLLPDRAVTTGIRLGVRLGAQGLLHDAGHDAATHLVEARARQGTEVNLNLVGEVVLGEAEASARAAAYESLVRTTRAQAISIKLSSIASQLSLAGFEASVESLRARLRAIYAAAMERRPHVLVNLDMEAFDDLGLTLEVHRRLSEEPALAALTTGVVLQAYLPDAHERYEALLDLARARARRGGAPLRVRIVKGANLSMERHLAALRGHPVPTYASKAETDASWLALVERACRADNARVLHLGIASHNLFDLAFALVVRAEQGVEAEAQLEMLEGMADPLRRVLARLAGSMLVYAPVVEPSAFDAAIAYLVRRLEEATAPGHFLRESFGMEVGDARYVSEQERFLFAARARKDVDVRSRRELERAVDRGDVDQLFANEPDTDWAVADARAPLLEAMERAKSAAIDPVRSLVGGEEMDGSARDGRDPSRPGVAAYAILEADEDVVERALAIAAQSRFGERSARERAELLIEVARAMRRARASLVATMVLDGGRRVTEADAEVSEAIDFAELYARSALALADDRRIRARPLGPVVVASPWNFPLAIGAGGMLGALAAGNPVLLKPSPKTPLVARELVRLALAAGVPADALALLVIDDRVATHLVRDPRTAAVVLTGSTATARKIRVLRPELPLFAETGGKGAMIVTSTADRDLAIRDALHSAFGHAGQKCSATSLLVCEREVYEDRGFRERLADAASSLLVGSAWEPANVVTPLIEPPRGPLARALSTLEPGESWLLPPRVDAENPALVAPSIKLDVQADGFTHRTELFGPVLGMIRADSLDHAIELANGTPYGLTGGLQALDPREQERWLARIEIGNAYVNRGTTGAIVRRQPFGGTKASCFGPGAKAGGPSYVRQLSRVEDGEPDAIRGRPSARVARWLALAAARLPREEAETLATIAAIDAATFDRELREPEDPSGLLTQRNLLVRVPRRDHALLVTDAATQVALLREEIALATIGVEVPLVFYGEVLPDWLPSLASSLLLLPLEEAPLARRIAGSGLRSLRVVGALDARFRRAAAAVDLRLLDGPSLRSSHDALAIHLEERSVTIEDHRYGQRLPDALRARLPRFSGDASGSCPRAR